MLEYQDYRYVIQNTGTLYVGAKFSFGDISVEEEVPFKFRSIMMKYALPEVDRSHTFESVFYYMQPEGYLYELFLQLHTKIKVSRLTEQKNIFGKRRFVYREHLYKLAEFTALSTKEKETLGIVIQEIQCSKLAIMTFSI